MLVLVVVLVVVALLVATSATFVFVGRRRKGPQPPSASLREAPRAAPPAEAAQAPPAGVAAAPPVEGGGVTTPVEAAGAPPLEQLEEAEKAEEEEEGLPAPAAEPAAAAGAEPAAAAGAEPAAAAGAEPAAAAGAEPALREQGPAPEGVLEEVAPGEAPEATEAEAIEAEAEVLPAPPRFRERLGKARSLLSGYLGSIRARDRLDPAVWEEAEEALVLADVGVEVAGKLLEGVRERARHDGIATPAALLDALKSEMVASLDGDRSLQFVDGATNVWLFVGVNGVGKTTTIGKVALQQRRCGRSVVMAAADTFRAAAVDQLELWAKAVDADIVRGSEGGDPGAVVFDAVQHAAAKGADLVLADTAGRLHTKVNLMEELKKVRRVADRPPGKVSEVLLVIDATTGQNGLAQARQFAEAVGVTGVVLTKLDGTAKGGIALAIASELGIPIKLVGLGEAPEDLVTFDPQEFVAAVFDAG